MSWSESKCADITVTTDKKSSEYHICVARSSRMLVGLNIDINHSAYICYGLRRMFF